MHAETPNGEDYATLADMAREYRDAHLVELKAMPHYNPHLGVDALCFQRLNGEGSGKKDGEDNALLLAGALITPCALWLVALPDETPSSRGAQVTVDPAADEFLLALPSGRYRLARHTFGRQAWYQRRVLDDLSELGSMQEAARLAQQLMARLMAPAVDEA